MLFQGGSGFTVLRCTSFALESCAHPSRRYSLADLLKYNFYLPFFFFGPIMTFDRFHEQVRQSSGAKQDPPQTGPPKVPGRPPEEATSLPSSDPRSHHSPQAGIAGRGKRLLPRTHA